MRFRTFWESAGQTLPQQLYHVTPHESEIRATGFKTGDAIGRSVFGGSTRDYVSFTDQIQRAEYYRLGLEYVIRAFKGEIDPDDYAAFQEIGRRFGAAGEMRQAYQQVMGDPRVRFRGKDPASRNYLAFEILSAFAQWTRGKFPLVMGSGGGGTFARMDPSDPTIMKVSTQNVKRWSYNPGEEEFRVHDPENLVIL